MDQAEKLRSVVKLKKQNYKPDARVITVTSGKGGVGKTTTTANVGTGLAKEGKKVVLIDTDIGLRNLDVVLGLENRSNVWRHSQVQSGRCDISWKTDHGDHIGRSDGNRVCLGGNRSYRTGQSDR